MLQLSSAQTQRLCWIIFRELLWLSIPRQHAGGLWFDNTVPKDKAQLQVRDIPVLSGRHFGSETEMFSLQTIICGVQGSFCTGMFLWCLKKIRKFKSVSHLTDGLSVRATTFFYMRSNLPKSRCYLYIHCCCLTRAKLEVTLAKSSTTAC